PAPSARSLHDALPIFKRLSEYYVLTWATMWEDLANTLLAPFYGIEPLPYVTWTENNAVKCMTRRLSQKTLDIEAYMLKKDAPFRSEEHTSELQSRFEI